ncbi:MAG TPA: Ig domain-containing protein, partial [Vicinamibacterales bacterium]|nr:Ig domain-containing protein [Vicinamibacterales bacterium]
ENVYWTTTNPYFTDSGAAGTSGTPPSATIWSVKNLFELKNAQDVLVEGNVMENLWVGGQPGYPVVFTPRNQNGTAPWTIVQRVTFQHNIVRHTAGGVNILGTDNLAPSQLTNHIVVRDNIFDDINTSWGSGAKVFQIGDGGDSIVFDHNTVVTNDTTIVTLYGGSVTSPTPITGFVYTNNMSEHRTYGIFGNNFSAGNVSIAAYLPASTITANVLAGGSASKYPAGNFFPTVAAWDAGFVNYAGGDYHLAAGSPYNNAGTDGTDLGPDVDLVLAYAANALTGDSRVAAGTAQVRITTTSLPDGMFESPYTQAIACVGGTPACAWQVVSSALPAGIAFDAASGVVRGTPTAVQTGNVTITAYDPSWPLNTSTATLNLTIDAPPFVETMPAQPEGQVGVVYTLTPTVTGTLGTATWSIASGALPAGLTFDPTSGRIAGTPTAWGTTTAVIEAADSWSPNRTAAQPATITIAPTAIAIASTSIASGVYRQPFAAALAATGGTGVATWSIAAGSLPAGLSLDSTGALTGTPTAIGAFTFSVQAVDANWPANLATAPLTLTVNAPAFSASLPAAPAGQVGLAYQTAAGVAQGAVGAITWTGSVPSGLVLNASNGSMAGVPSAFGSFTVALQAHDSYDASRVATAAVTITIAPAPLVIATAAVPSGSVNAVYSAALATIGGSGQTTWTLASGALPGGLTFSNGVISGTPAATGTSTFTVSAVDANWPSNVASATYSLAIVETTLLDDRFDILDRTKWPNAPFTSSQDYTVPVGVTSGQLQTGPLKPALSGSHYDGIASAAYDLTNNGYGWVQLAQPPNVATPAYAMFAAGSDGNNFYRMYESGNTIVAEKKISGAKTTLVTVPYDRTAHQFLRIRNDVDDAGVKHVVFEAAPDNGGTPGAFTALYREAWDTHVGTSAIKFEIKGGTSDSIAAPGTIWWDNFHAGRR